MTDVYSLLTLPKTSDAFSALKKSVGESTDGSASPRHKAARLDTDSDAASASRSNTNGTRLNATLTLKITGDQLIKRDHENSSSHLKLLNDLTRSIRVILAPPQKSETKDVRLRLAASYEEIYTACQSVVVVAQRGEELYDRLRLELEQSIGRLAHSLATQDPEIKDKRDKDDLPILWLADFVAGCDWFEREIALLMSLMTYLDQAYVTTNSKAVNIHTLAYSLFEERIFGNANIQLRLREGVLQWGNYERKLRMAHSLRSEIPKLIAHLSAHNQYSAFEDFYLKIIRDFYTAESLELARSMKASPLEFFAYVNSRIEEEQQRSRDVLPTGSWGVAQTAMEECIWGDQLEWLANNTVGVHITNKEFSTLATMYRLFKRVEGVKFLISAVRSHIQKRVEDIVKDTAEDEQMVERLLECKRLVDTIISTAFLDEKTNLTSSALVSQRNPDFVRAVSDAFSIGFKARRNKPAEMIARYLDRTMRKGQGASSDAEFEQVLDSALALYRFTDDKDVFRMFYHRYLAKRLLLQKSASDDFEAAMLKKLKEQYDPEFGMGEDMFKDLALSRESMRDYHSKLPSGNAGHKLTVMTLQRSAWPFTVSKSSVDLPPSMQADLTAYTNYYKERHSGHALDWDHALGTATLTARFKPGKKELSVSLYQTVVLLLFNEEIEWRYPEILEQTGIEAEELKRVLQSLACGKKKVLRKVPPGRDVEESDVFRFNAEFDDPRAKIHINSIQAKVSPEESRRTTESIEGDRKHVLDAAIVRIMKARKELTYEQLKTATIDAVKNHFVPTVDSIKKRIDALVEGEYLERNPDDQTKFLYVA